ncbi:MAG: carbohydrate-binding family 9-like protein [Acidobacteriota bacterium]
MPSSFSSLILASVVLGSGTLLAQPGAAPPKPDAANGAPLPRYQVKRAPSPPVIDGKLDEKAWEQATPAVTLQFLWENQTGAKQKTAVRMLWDDRNLYLAYDCDDADITAQFQNRDDPTYQDDAVEIFINPRPSQDGLYFGFEMNVRGILYDYANHGGRTLVKQYNADGVRIATFLRGTMNVRGDKDQGWSLEAAIPWSNFDSLSRPPQVGTVWKANINRWDGIEPDRRMSIWSDPQQETPWPHIPQRFGDLAFVQ